MRALLCHNREAGGGRYRMKELRALLALAGIDAKPCKPTGSGLARALRRPCDFVVAAGGDGTIGKIVGSLPSREVPIAILPLGTANNVARSLGVSGLPLPLIESWNADDVQPLYVGEVAGPFERKVFVEALGIGVFAAFVSDVGEALSGAKSLRAGRAAVAEALKEARAIACTIRIDGSTYDREELLAIEVVNTPYVGPALRMPMAESAPTLSVVAVGVRDRDAVLSWLAAPHRSAMPVGAVPAREVELVWRDAAVRVDDEVVTTSDGMLMARAGRLPFQVLRPARGVLPFGPHQL